MGTSTDAILVYGIAMLDYDEQRYEDLPFAEAGEEDFEATVSRLAGAAQYPQDGWIEQKRQAVAASPITLVTHCHIDVPMWILGLKSTETVASRGYPERIHALDIGDSGDEQALLEFAAKHDIDGDPQWYLCSLWA